MRKILLATAFSLVIASSAMAWDNTNNGPGNNQIVDQGGIGNQNVNKTVSVANAKSNASVGNVNGSSHNRLNNTVNITGVGSDGNNLGYRDIPVASAIAPSFGGGMNNCSGTASSLAGQFQLFGVSVGGTNMDDVCRAKGLGELDTAREVLCDDSRAFRNAAYRTGHPCMVDNERFVKEHPVQVVTTTVHPLDPKTAKVCQDPLYHKYNPVLCGVN